MVLLYTVSYHIILYLHFFLLPDALYLIDVESVRERCTESHEVIASLHVDGRRVQESTSDYAVFCARAASAREEKRKVILGGLLAEKKVRHDKVYQIQRRSTQRRRTRARPVLLHAPHGRFRRGPDTNRGAEPGPTQDQRWSYCT